MVEVDDLRNVRQPRVARLERRVVAARPAVKEKQRRHFAHAGAVGTQLGALDIEEHPNITNLNAHRDPAEATLLEITQ